ncbi:MAG: DUF3261 domain-containing protein [Methylococcales bacterium]|nr:DUF3261 domain-containing protein [Methylococcales bacterium]MBT7410178.1 DUF3261 domain-containing protein [Methylococcales bacterium]
MTAHLFFQQKRRTKLLRNMGSLIIACHLRIFLLISIVSLSACTGLIKTQKKTVEIAKNTWFTLQTPNSLGSSIRLVQQIESIYQKESHVFISQVEVTPEKLTIVGMTPMGIKLFSLTWDGKELQHETSLLTQMKSIPFKLDYILADFQMTYWPKLSAGNRFNYQDKSQPSHHRTIFNRNTKVVSIHYQKDSPWQGKIEFKHLERGYQLNITTLQFENL